MSRWRRLGREPLEGFVAHTAEAAAGMERALERTATIRRRLAEAGVSKPAIDDELALHDHYVAQVRDGLMAMIVEARRRGDRRPLAAAIVHQSDRVLWLWRRIERRLRRSRRTVWMLDDFDGAA